MRNLVTLLTFLVSSPLILTARLTQIIHYGGSDVSSIDGLVDVSASNQVGLADISLPTHSSQGRTTKASQGRTTKARPP